MTPRTPLGRLLAGYVPHSPACPTVASLEETLALRAAALRLTAEEQADVADLREALAKKEGRR